MKLPTREQCFGILKEHDVPENVMKHTLAVNKVAVFLAKKLREKGINIDVDVIDRASLLHDLDKIKTLGTKEHGKVSKKILSSIGYPELGEIVFKHLFSGVLNRGYSWEDKVVHYADKRCTEDKIVSLKDRFDYIRGKYVKRGLKQNPEIEKLILDTEKEIFEIIELDPEKLDEYIKENEY